MKPDWISVFPEDAGTVSFAELHASAMALAGSDPERSPEIAFRGTHRGVKVAPDIATSLVAPISLPALKAALDEGLAQARPTVKPQPEPAPDKAQPPKRRSSPRKKKEA